MRSVGQRVVRPDARAHVAGLTKFVGDLDFPGMLHAKIKRAGIAAALIRRIDTSAAEALPGVAAVVTGADIPVNSFGPSLQDQPLLSDQRVFHAGDGVAAVAAVDESTARRALEHIVVDYEPITPVFDPLEALREDAPRVHAPASNVYVHKVIRRGDVERAMASADRVFERRYRTQMVEHVSLEPHAAIAQWDANGRLTIYATLGRISLARADIARVLALPMNRIRVIGAVGGNFGGKNEITHEPVLALLARKAGRPVKGVFDRVEEFTATTTRHPIVMDYRTGVRSDGRILAREVRLVLDGGAYCSWSETTLAKACILSPGPYRIDHLRAEAFAVYTNKTMTGAMRGFGAPQVCFAYESQMDEIAEGLGIDPLEIRLLNGFEEGSTSPTGQTLHSVALKASLSAAAERFGWSRERT